MKALFLDDERFPIFLDIENIEHPSVNWDIVRSVEDAIKWVEVNGFPDIVSFDNDLQRELEGKDFAKYLSKLDLDTGTMPEDFKFIVHSKNPVAKKDIVSILENHLKERDNYIKNGQPWPPGPSPFGI